MYVTDLPEEILILIIQYLDTKSIHNLYHASQYMKNTIIGTRAVKRCQMSMNTLATVCSLKSDFFKAIAPHLLELNLCGVPDLRKSYLIPAMKKLKCLRILDVSFTNIDLMDFLDIYEVCPTITSLAINITANDILKIHDNVITLYQDIFKGFQHIHFIGTDLNLSHSKLPCVLLNRAQLESFKFSIAKSNQFVFEKIDVPRPVEDFKQHTLCFNVNDTSFPLPVLSTQYNIRTIEGFIIVKHNFKEYLVHDATPIFQNYFRNTFGVGMAKVSEIEIDCCGDNEITGNLIIMIWKKEANVFNDDFFEKLTKLMKPFFPHDCQWLKGSSVLDKCDRLYLTLDPAAEYINMVDNDCVKPSTRADLKRRRIAPPMNVLNCDQLFESKERVELFLTFDGFFKNPLSLPSNCDYLKKLTFLSMTGIVRLGSDFFNVLFKSCVNLITVNIELSMSLCTLPVSRTIHWSQRLKNFRLTDKKIQFMTLFSALAECKTLENVCVVELTSGEADIGDPSRIIENCPNLYSLYIQAPMSECKRKKKSQILQSIKTRLHKHHLNIVLPVKSNRDGYDPFLSVFNLNPISQIV